MTLETGLLEQKNENFPVFVIDLCRLQCIGSPVVTQWAVPGKLTGHAGLARHGESYA
jgi:hypothetical protein